MTTTTYSQRQIMLCLAYLAYTDQQLPNSEGLDAQIKIDLSAGLSSQSPLLPVAGNWTIVWGPVTYTVPGAISQDNMMYVAQLSGGGSPAQYAVAVRGTAGQVLLDWLLEDFDILQMVPWSGADDANISESTSIGLAALLAMQDPAAGTLLDFLSTVMSASGAPQAGICFTGHSLGSALASTLALYIRDCQQSWDPNGLATVTTINFAGPSAGDAGFAAYFDSQFAYTENALPYWVSPAFSNASTLSYADCVRNSLDIAPCAWNASSLQSIPKIYEGHVLEDILPPLGTTEIVGCIVKVTQANAYTQIQSDQVLLNGTFIDANKLQTGEAFFQEAEYQHHDSYPNLLDVPELLAYTPIALRADRSGSALVNQIRAIVNKYFAPLIDTTGNPSADKAPGGIAAVYLGEERFFFPYGKIDEAGRAPTRDTVFGLGSITKVFTTSILGQSSALFDLPVSDYAPAPFQLSSSEQQVTFSQLATFTGGINPSYPPKADARDQAGFVRFINACAPESLPSPDQYSNTSIGFLGQVLISATYPTGYDKADVTQKWYASNLFAPLSMNYTTTAPARKDSAHPLSRAFQYDASTQTYNTTPYEGWCPWGTAGRTFSTAHDMLNFVMANVGVTEIEGQTVPTKILDGMVQALIPRFEMPSGNGSQAFAWVVQPQDRKTKSSTRFKNGGLTGVSSVVLVNPERKFGLVLLTNMMDVSPTAAGQKIMAALMPLS
jgi:CubicO group peptidase (beta-lactamase class C family)